MTLRRATPRTTPFSGPGDHDRHGSSAWRRTSPVRFSRAERFNCWGGNALGRLGNGTINHPYTPVIVSGISTAIAITAGRGHACAVLSGGTVKCWGDNSSAMLGNGTTTNSSMPITVTGLTNVVALTAGAVHTCARLSDGTVKCWGDNANAQVGPGSITNSTTPASVLRYSSFSSSTPVSGVSAAAAGSLHGCGLINNGTVNCWGWNGSDQLGTTAYARSSTANPVSGVSAATALTAGGWHTCALLSGGTVQCWGENLNGQLGNGASVNPRTLVTVSGLSTASGVAAGSARTCAVLTNGTVQCWGDNDQGQLGNGTTSTSPIPTPVAVSGVSTATAVTGGYNHACASLTDGSVRCWGDNTFGQLGSGTLAASSPVPVKVSGIGGTLFCTGIGPCPQPLHATALRGREHERSRLRGD